MSTSTSLSTIEGALTPRPPFDFAKTLGFLGYFTPTEGEQRLEDNSMIKAVTLNGRAVAFELRNTGTVQEPRIAYTLFSEQPLTDAEHEAIKDRIRFFLSLDDDLQPFYTVGLADPHFSPVIQRLYGFHQPKFLTPFEIACWAVLVQRNPMAIAHRIKMKLVERWGTSITLPGGIYHAFPEPQQLVSVEMDELATIVRNARKVEYLRAVIQFFDDVDEQFLRSGNYDDVATRIRAIRGIGEWSSYFILIRGLGRMEYTPIGEKEQLKAASNVYNQGRPLTAADIERLAEPYGSARGYWAFYIRNALFDNAAPMMGSNPL